MKRSLASMQAGMCVLVGQSDRVSPAVRASYKGQGCWLLVRSQIRFSQGTAHLEIEPTILFTFLNQQKVRLFVFSSWTLLNILV